METTLYADILFFVNFSMDFISLWIAAVLTGSERKALLMCAASAAGALYGVISVIAGLEGIMMYLSAAAVSALMALIAFGHRGGFLSVLKKGALVWGCGAILGGIMSAVIGAFDSAYTYSGEKLQTPLPVYFVLTALLAVITARLIRTVKRKSSVQITLTYCGRSVTFEALCDSGNLLHDPISGDPVIPVSAHVIKSLTGETVLKALCNCDADTLNEVNMPVRIIPFTGMGVSSVACAMRPDRIIVKSEKKQRTAACLITPLEVPQNYFGGFAATVSDELIP